MGKAYHKNPEEYVGIGYISKESQQMRGYVDQGIYTKKEKESGKLRMGGGSWTIPIQVFDKKGIHTIKYLTGRYRYTIDKLEAWQNGFDRNFRGEEKVVVPLKYWKKEKLS